MSDATVASALRSTARLVVIEAPAGCGKTYQAAQYALEAARAIQYGRVLILTHTHAACDVFASRTRESRSYVEIRTIDSLIGLIASAYHLALGLPAETGTWARTRPKGYEELASKVARLVRASPIVARSIALRFPIIICDEHQDASPHQNTVILAFFEAGAMLRIFADPMQRIFGGKKKAELESEITAQQQQWAELSRRADARDALDFPHRW